ncbi:ABC-three component system protein [Arcobacter cloacae]|uniref:HNH endonuclease n=1 Tax=Arcobacter cloacae TaxID=1054034 RepID=A0A4Q0ZJL7_9BACT|nr:ABC-three component system protein [Arcobacter cloacae]RXJ85361.1 HNH endonuclease [Arcobacter cloacae]
MSNARKKYTENQYIILFNEVDGLCPICSIKLIYEKANKLNKRVNLAHIYPHSPTLEEAKLLENVERLSDDVDNIKNIIWLCPNCHEKFDKPRTLEGYNEILNIKKKILQKREIEEEFNSYQIEEEIKKILNILSEDSYDNEEANLEFNPITIDSKLNETIKPLTKNKIKNNVRDFFHIVKKEFKNIDAIKVNKATLIAQQIKVFYLKTMDKNSNQEDIFNYLVSWLNKKTQISEDASSIVISYFIQNCEVFDVVTE